ncbi:MAG: HU family DNA-binding protein [Bacteroidaceae bacterium]|nr:HU family DNA-binding protein [Bacteroidaceae bacterium]
MNNKLFLKELSKRCDINMDTAQSMLQSLLEVMQKQWQEGDSVSITGFGLFEVKKKNERISVNPGTKKRVLIPPKLVLSFKPSVMLKDKLNSKDL